MCSKRSLFNSDEYLTNKCGRRIVRRWYKWFNMAVFNESRRGSRQFVEIRESIEIVWVGELNNDGILSEIEHWAQALGQRRSVVIDFKR